MLLASMGYVLQSKGLEDDTAADSSAAPSESRHLRKLVFCLSYLYYYLYSTYYTYINMQAYMVIHTYKSLDNIIHIINIILYIVYCYL